MSLNAVPTIVCFSCHSHRSEYQVEYCPSCGVPTCGITPCKSRCKCDKSNLDPNPESLLADPEFHRIFCFNNCDNPKTCFLRTRSHITFVQDSEGRFVHASPSVITGLGLNVSDLLGRTVYDVCDLETAVRLRRMEIELRAGGEPQTEAVQWLHRDGHPMTWLVRKALLPNGLLIGVAVDITAFEERQDTHDAHKLTSHNPVFVSPSAQFNGHVWPIVVAAILPMAAVITKYALHVVAVATLALSLLPGNSSDTDQPLDQPQTVQHRTDKPKQGLDIIVPGDTDFTDS